MNELDLIIYLNAGFGCGYGSSQPHSSTVPAGVRGGFTLDGIVPDIPDGRGEC